MKFVFVFFFNLLCANGVKLIFLSNEPRDPECYFEGKIKQGRCMNFAACRGLSDIPSLIISIRLGELTPTSNIFLQHLYGTAHLTFTCERLPRQYGDSRRLLVRSNSTQSYNAFIDIK